MSEYKLGKLKGRYVVQWREEGKRRRYRLFGPDEAETKTEALKRIEQFKRQSQLKAAPTISELWEAYRKEKEGRRIATTMAFEWRTMQTHFGHIKAEEITTEDCRKYTAARRKAGKKDGTIWTELGHLRTVLRWAEKHQLIEHARPVERPAKPAPKDRYLTEYECQRLIENAHAHHIKLAIILLLSTAGRIGAVLELTWDRIDFDKGQINLKTDTTGPRKGRATVPMNAGARSALQHAKQGAQTEFVIEWNDKPVKSIKTGFGKACELAGLENVTPHVLRHTAAVHMVQAGIPIIEVAQYLGHSNPQITYSVYARFSPDHLQKAANVLDFTKIRQVQ